MIKIAEKETELNSMSIMKLLYCRHQIIFLFFTLSISGQVSKIDSLMLKLAETKEDTSKVSLYLKICNTCEIKDNMRFAQPAIELANKLLFKEENPILRKRLMLQKARAYYACEIFYDSNHDSSSTHKFLNNRLLIYKEIGDSLSLVNGLIETAAFYEKNGDKIKALNTYQNALARSKEYNYKKGIAYSLGNLARLFKNQGDYDATLNCYKSKIIVLKEIGDTSELADVLIFTADLEGQNKNIHEAELYYAQGISLYKIKKNFIYESGSYSHMGDMYESNNDLARALQCYRKSYFLDSVNLDKRGLAIALNRIGSIYAKMGNFKQALYLHYKALKLEKEINGGSWSYNRLAETYYLQGNFPYAKKYIDLYILHSNNAYFKDEIGAELLAARIDSANGLGMSAFEHYKKFIILTDKSKSDEVRKAAIREKFRSDYEKQKAVDKLEQDRKDLAAKDETQRQMILRNCFIGGFILLLILVAVILRGYQEKKKSNDLLAKKNVEIEEKNEDIMGSIRYAKRIQTSLLPTDKYIHRILNQLSKNSGEPANDT